MQRGIDICVEVAVLWDMIQAEFLMDKCTAMNLVLQVPGMFMVLFILRETGHQWLAGSLIRFPAASRLCSGCPATASPQGPGFITKAVPGLIQPGLLWNNTKAPARLSMPQVHNSFQSYWRHFWEQGIPSADRDDLWMSRGLTAVVTHYTQTDTDTQRHTLVTSRTLWPAQPNCAYKHWETPLSGTLRFKVGERLKTRTMPCVRSICTSKFL